jgi:hypothetical protein
MEGKAEREPAEISKITSVVAVDAGSEGIKCGTGDPTGNLCRLWCGVPWEWSEGGSWRQVSRAGELRVSPKAAHPRGNCDIASKSILFVRLGSVRGMSHVRPPGLRINEDVRGWRNPGENNHKNHWRISRTPNCASSGRYEWIKFGDNRWHLSSIAVYHFSI